MEKGTQAFAIFPTGPMPPKWVTVCIICMEYVMGFWLCINWGGKSGAFWDTFVMYS